MGWCVYFLCILLKDFNAFQTKMGFSKITFFRRVLGYASEHILRSEDFFIIPTTTKMVQSRKPLFNHGKLTVRRKVHKPSESIFGMKCECF